MKPQVSDTALIEALRGLDEVGDDGGMTLDELAEALGIVRNTAWRRIKPLVESGKVVVRKTTRINIVGRRCETFLYSWRGE